MAYSLNKVQIIGNLGADPEIRFTQDGRPIASLNVATSEKWKDKSSGEAREKTEWHRVSMFGWNAEFAQNYLRKGAKVYIEGSLQTRKWTDNQGQDRYSTDIVVNPYGGQLIPLDSRGGAMGGGGGAPMGGGGAPMGGGGAPAGGGQQQQYGQQAPQAQQQQQPQGQPQGQASGGPAGGFDQAPDFDDDIPF